jgi:YVTN family beta-propeller protein
MPVTEGPSRWTPCRGRPVAARMVNQNSNEVSVIDIYSNTVVDMIAVGPEPGSIKEHVMFLQYGSGTNGKTVFSEPINHLAGDYARTADASLLLTRRSEGPRHDIARLRRARSGALSVEFPIRFRLSIDGTEVACCSPAFSELH